MNNIMKNRNGLSQIFDNSTSVRVLDYLVDLDGLECTIKDIMEGTELSRNSVVKVMKNLEGHEIIVTRTIGKNIMCMMDHKNKLTKLLGEMNRILLKMVEDHIESSRK